MNTIPAPAVAPIPFNTAETWFHIRACVMFNGGFDRGIVDAALMPMIEYLNLPKSSSGTGRMPKFSFIRYGKGVEGSVIGVELYIYCYADSALQGVMTQVAMNLAPLVPPNSRQEIHLNDLTGMSGSDDLEDWINFDEPQICVPVLSLKHRIAPPDTSKYRPFVKTEESQYGIGAVVTFAEREHLNEILNSSPEQKIEIVNQDGVRMIMSYGMDGLSFEFECIDPNDARKLPKDVMNSLIEHKQMHEALEKIHSGSVGDASAFAGEQLISLGFHIPF